ncbi:ARM repeat-containing protein [Pseudovirgaria hyperparasitica]|uniref:ARM repeat-containing protein n=1 Tax=Pseudovirgaria hyperparasitica TaxID=470096 RepID=A0A6A6W3W5_9PEZI|nr:ARM repeat-containing protein [Pseudovirgaria hyperparasitica]KAF2756247.1 ARM repeat-containing protein [Pseudovirgaria hyperparasitica]
MDVEGPIEVPGEANPLTEGILFNVLRSASSSDPQQIQSGTKQLQKWETSEGFYPLLQTVFIDQRVPRDVRYLAIIKLKNGIDKYWRKTATNAVSKEDKAKIRARLLESGINEADAPLALQNAIAVAKIARFEYPNDWPDAIQQLLNILRQSILPGAYRLHLPRALLILLHLIKDLSAGRLLRTKQNLQAIAPEILHVLGKIYLEKVQIWETFLRQGGDDEGGALDDIETSLMAIKALRRLLITGYEFPHRDADVQQFWAITLQKLTEFKEFLPKDSPLSIEVQRRIARHLTQLNKLHVDMARTHPSAFVLLPQFSNIIQSYWDTIMQVGETFGIRSVDDIGGYVGSDGDAGDEYEDVTSILERSCQRGLLIFRACIKMVFNPAQTFKYRQEKEKEERTQAQQIVKEQILTEGFVRTILELVITKFFVYRQSDLRQWEEEPEEWEKREDAEGEDFEFSIRSASEKLFLDLAINFKNIVIEPLINVFCSVSTPNETAILSKDSIYTAIGLAAPVLSQHLDFDAFINNTLLQEVRQTFPGCSLLRRRIAILLGQWITVKVSNDSKRPVYHIFEQLLDRNDISNDQVVRITAARHFKHAADEWEFKPENFLPYAPTVLTRIMELIEEVELSETKMALLNTVSVIVEGLEQHISPYADRIVKLLSPLWDQSGQEHLMKQAILVILARLINAMRAESQVYHSLVLPIIKGAVEPESETRLYLLEDALDLWGAILAQSPAPASADLIALAPYLLDVLETGSDALRISLDLTQLYVLLAPSDILSDQFRGPLIQRLASLMGTLTPDANGTVTSLTEIIIRAAHQFGGEQAIQVLVGDMVSTGFLPRLIKGLKGAWAAHQRTGPKAPASSVDGIVETDYFAVLARIGTASPQVLLEAINMSLPDENPEETMKWLLEEWFSHFENIADPPRRKLMALLFARLMETNADWILAKLQDLMTVWTDVIIELTDGTNDQSTDCLVWAPPDPNTVDLSAQTPEDARMSVLVYADVVHTVNIVALVRERIQASITLCGGQERFHELWLVNVDKEVIAAFSKLEGVM